MRRSKKFFESALRLSEKYSEKWIKGVSKAFSALVSYRLNSNLHSFQNMEAKSREGIQILEDRKILPYWLLNSSLKQFCEFCPANCSRLLSSHAVQNFSLTLIYPFI
jgi:hypothetical protein